MRRREFIVGVAGAAAWPLSALAQQPTVPVVGFLHPASASSSAHLVAAFRQGLTEAGRVEGQNVALEFRFAEGRYDRLPELANELVHLHVAVIAANGGDPSVLAARAATITIPIVFNTGSDPIKLGLVGSLNLPGGNITGINQLTGLIAGKQLELLHELLPEGAAIGLMENPANPAAATRTKELRAAAQALGRTIYVIDAGTENEIHAGFATLVQLRVGGFLIVGDSILLSLRSQIVTLATHYKLPGIYSRREYTEIGGLMSYGASITDSYRLAGTYAGRILKGEKPSELPVQQSTKVELIINMKTAKIFGLTIPALLVRRADEVIE